MYFIIYRYQKGLCVSLQKFTKDRYFFLSDWSSGYLQGKEHKIHIVKYEYEISHNKYPAIFHDPWILSLKSETSEESDEGKFGCNFIKVILVIWRLLKTKIFIQEKNNSETSSAYWSEIKLIIQIAHFCMQHENSGLDTTHILMSGKEVLKRFFTMKSNRNLRADKSKTKVLLFLTENI